MRPLPIIVGPTASGKTELAVRLAEELGGEVVSADSMQLYRHFDIGTGKPNQMELERVPHHLIDEFEPTQHIDAARFQQLADERLADIRSRGRQPIVCGGTFLWVRALIFGLAEAPPQSAHIRQRHRSRVERDGRPALHEELRSVDPVLAEKLNPNDMVRVSRGLEVFELTGRPLSQWQADHGFREPRFPVRLIGIERSREQLDERIRVRVTQMFEQGFVAEVRMLRDRGFADTRPMRSVGYRQINDALTADSPVDEAELQLKVYRAHRVYARRQRTWLRDEKVAWLAPDETDLKRALV